MATARMHQSTRQGMCANVKRDGWAIVIQVKILLNRFRNQSIIESKIIPFLTFKNKEDLLAYKVHANLVNAL
jgi:hypothetical protein